MNNFQGNIGDDVMAVQKLLEDWNLPELKQIFADEEISIRTLDCLEEDDKQLREIIPKFGTRKVFLSYLKKWKETRNNMQKDCQQTKDCLNMTPNLSNNTPNSLINNLITNYTVSTAEQNPNLKTSPLQQYQNEQSSSNNLSLPTKILPNSVPIKQDIKLDKVLKISQPYTLTINKSETNITHQPKLHTNEKNDNNQNKIPALKINLRKVKKPTRKIKKKVNAHKYKNRKGKKPTNLPNIPKLNYKEYNGEELNIVELLMEAGDLYKDIFSYYDENHALNQKFRQELIEILNLAVFERRIKRGPELRKVFNNFADQIIQCFPTEQKEIYMDSNGFKGKLINKYYNFQRDLRMANINY